MDYKSDTPSGRKKKEKIIPELRGRGRPMRPPAGKGGKSGLRVLRMREKAALLFGILEELDIDDIWCASVNLSFGTAHAYPDKKERALKWWNDPAVEAYRERCVKELRQGLFLKGSRAVMTVGGDESHVSADRPSSAVDDATAARLSMVGFTDFADGTAIIDYFNKRANELPVGDEKDKILLELADLVKLKQKNSATKVVRAFMPLRCSNCNLYALGEKYLTADLRKRQNMGGEPDDNEVSVPDENEASDAKPKKIVDSQGFISGPMEYEEYDYDDSDDNEGEEEDGDDDNTDGQ